MKKVKLSLVICLCLSIVLALCGCGAKPIPEYNIAVEGRTVDKTNPQSVIENAVLVDVYDKMSECEAVASVYHEYAKEQSGKKTVYYIVATVGGYLYENGKLTRNYGHSPFAAKITLKQQETGYDVVGFSALRSYTEEEEREAFIAENFPKGTTVEKLFSGRATALFDAEKQQIIENYGFNETDFATGEELIELLPVTNEAYYTLIEYFSGYPEWLGDIVRIEDGVHYTYKTSYYGEDGGKGVVTYVKTNEAGEEVEHYDINVDGDKVELPEELLYESEDGIVLTEPEPEEEGTESKPKVQVDPEGTTKYTPEELEEIMKEFDYDDGIEYTLVD